MPGGRSSADDVVVLEGLEAVRRRPAMYVGDLADPETLVCLVFETLCLTAEQVTLGAATRATITIARDAVTVEDDGIGLPVALQRNGEPEAAVLLSSLMACRLAKLDPELGGRYCSNGIVVTNALSEFFEVDFVTDGARWTQRYERGRATGPMVCTGPSTDRGTRIRFMFDRSILGETTLSADRLRARVAAHDELRGRVTVVDLR